MKKSLKPSPINSDDFKEIQNLSLEILKIVHDICQKHNINYFLVYGTLLGAVRHKGFIPWDDDIDIGMFREDYDKFMNIAPTELPSHYELISLYTSKYRKLPYAKVFYTNTPYFQMTTLPEGEYDDTYNKGVFIDIFPIDKISGNNIDTAIKNVNNAKHKYGVFTTLLYQRNQHVNWKFKILNFILKPLSNKTLEKLALNSLTKDENKNCTYCTTFGGAYTSAKETMNMEFFLPVKSIPFEQYCFNVPNNPHAILSHLYGDYMTPPPIEARKNQNHDFVKITTSDLQEECNDSK